MFTSRDFISILAEYMYLDCIDSYIKEHVSGNEFESANEKTVVSLLQNGMLILL